MTGARGARTPADGTKHRVDPSSRVVRLLAARAEYTDEWAIAVHLALNHLPPDAALLRSGTE